MADAIDYCLFAGSEFQVRHPPLGCAHSMDPATMAYLARVAHHAELHPDVERGPSDLQRPVSSQRSTSDTSAARLVAEVCPGALYPLWLEWRRTDLIITKSGTALFHIQGLILKLFSCFINLSYLVLC